MTAKKDDKPKRKAPVPIPVVGVRGSSTKVSLAKVAGVVGGVSVAGVAPSGRAKSAFGALADGNTERSVNTLMERAREIWSRHGTKIALGGAAALLFGAAFDRRHPDLPIRLGK